MGQTNIHQVVIIGLTSNIAQTLDQLGIIYIPILQLQVVLHLDIMMQLQVVILGLE
jgi:hypothetical protein